MPFFYDLRAISGISRIYYKLIDAYTDDTQSNESDLEAADEIIKTTQKLSHYKSKYVAKVTWNNVVEFGDDTMKVLYFEIVFTIINGIN